MLETLITSKTRIKLITRFFLNPESTTYLRRLSEEFGESSNAVRVELNRFEDAGLLDSYTAGNKKMYQANSQHPLFNDLHKIVRKTLGIDKLVEHVIKELGGVEKAYLTGSFAEGRDGQTIDIVIVGLDINMAYLINLVEKVEKMIARRIRYLVMDSDEANKYLTGTSAKMLVWSK